MYVIGNAEEAEGLADECLKRVKEIYEETRQLQFELKKLQESFQDNGIEEVNDVVMKVYMEIDRHLDDVKSSPPLFNQVTALCRDTEKKLMPEEGRKVVVI